MVGQVYCGQPVWGWCEANWFPQEYGGLWHRVCGLIWDISCTLHYLYVYPLFYWSSLLLVGFDSRRREAVPSGWFWFLYLSTGGLSHGCCRSCNTLRLAVKKPCPAYKLSEHGITFKVAFLKRQGPVVLLVEVWSVFPNINCPSPLWWVSVLFDGLAFACWFKWQNWSYLLNFCIKLELVQYNSCTSGICAAVFMQRWWAWHRCWLSSMQEYTGTLSYQGSTLVPYPVDLLKDFLVFFFFVMSKG